MKPTQSDVHVNRPLSNILVAFFQDAGNAIATSAFPNVPVEHKTDVYYKWKRDDFFRIEVKERAPGTPAEQGGFDLQTDSFEAKEYAIAKDIPDAIRDNADTELNLDEAATRYIGHQLLLKREQIFNTSFIKTGVWTGSGGTNGGADGNDLTGTSAGAGSNEFKQWDQASSTPIEDIRKQIIAVQEKTGYKPNKLIVGPKVWLKLQDHAELLDRIKYTQKGVVTADLLTSLLGLDQILVGSLVQNTAKQGATSAFSFIHGKSAVLLYAPPAASKFEPSAGYTFTWTGRFGVGPLGERVKRYYVTETESWRIEGQQAYAMKVVAPELGVFFNTAVA